MKLDDLVVYRKSMALADSIWNIVLRWQYFERSTIGRQWVNAADSISANISESFGRYHYKDSRNFLYFARGSLSETVTWLSKAQNRSLIEEHEYQELSVELKDLWVRLNNYINCLSTTSKLNFINFVGWG
jgi:four helix bundle protein